MYKESTVKKAIKQIEQTREARETTLDEQLFLGGALFALEWLMGQKLRRPAKYVQWVRDTMSGDLRGIWRRIA